MDFQRKSASLWFYELRDRICSAFKQIEDIYANEKGLTAGNFERKNWTREGGGGGEMSVMRGVVFEKVGVNVSTVKGEFSPEFQKQIPGAENDPRFFATGISVVAHMSSPHVPAMHFNTRYIETSKSWFGGGGDLTPIFEDPLEAAKFHNAFKTACDQFDTSYYPKFKEACDKYFYLKHRNEQRGIGGIFYDYLNTGSFDKDFAFTKEIGKSFLDVSQKIIKEKMNLKWTSEQRELQLKKRGRYVEFNLLYDRGTHFGLMTGGNVEAILMSLPPLVSW